MKQWEIVADNLSKSGFSLGWVSAIDLEGRTIWIVDAHRDGKRFIVRADEKLTAFLELESTPLAATQRKYSTAVNLPVRKIDEKLQPRVALKQA